MARSFGHATSASSAVRERESKDEQAPKSRFFAAGSQCAQELEVAYGSLGLNLWGIVLAFAGIGLVARHPRQGYWTSQAPSMDKSRRASFGAALFWSLSK